MKVLVAAEEKLCSVYQNFNEHGFKFAPWDRLTFTHLHFGSTVIHKVGNCVQETSYHNRCRHVNDRLPSREQIFSDLFAFMTRISHQNPPEFLGKVFLPLPYCRNACVHHVYLHNTQQTQQPWSVKMLHILQCRTSFCLEIRDRLNATASPKQGKILNFTYRSS